MSQLDLSLENPPKTFCFAFNETLFVALFMRIKSISLRLNILDLNKHTAELTLKPNRNIRMAALVEARPGTARLFFERKCLPKNRRWKPTGFTFMFINTQCGDDCHLNT